ncbi:MAG: DUF883 family protein [Burkholderiales bacterium]
MIDLLHDSAHGEKLVADLKAVVADAEELLRDTAHQTGDKVAELRARVEARLARTRARLSEAEHNLLEKGRAAARATDNFVHEEPWKSVGIAALIGLAVGVLIGRR